MSFVSINVLDFLSPLLLWSQELVVLAAIGNPEAKTYGMSFAYMGMLLMAISLGFLIMMIGLRSKQAQGERSPFISRTDSSNWIASKQFVIGWGIAVLSAFFLVIMLPYFILYYTRLKDEGFRWCYECSGLMFWTGPDLSVVVLAMCSGGIVIGVAMVATKGRQRINCKSR